MKFSSKRIVAVILAAVVVFSASIAFGSFSAAEEKDSSAVTTAVTEPGTEATEAPAPAKAEEAVGATSAAQTTAPTQPATVAPEIPVTVVGNVTNIQKTSFEPHVITLTWNPVQGASGYYVYCLNADGGKWTKIMDVTAATATVKNLKHTTQYWFKVSAYLKVNGQKLEGQTTLKKTATQPEPVSNLYASRSSTLNEFKWNRNDRATGYKIYRACGKTNGQYELYKVIKGNQNRVFTDTNVEVGRAYYYKVYAFRELYGGSYGSTNSCVKFLTGLCAPNFGITSRVYRANLTWNHNRYADGYDIFYSDKQSSGFKKLGSTSSNYYNTVRLTNNKTYYFRVRPYSKVGSSTVYGTYTTKSVKIFNGAFGEAGESTYIEISIRQQHMWLYKNGKLLVETDVVTGNNDGVCNTPTGYHRVFSRATNTTLVGPGYASFVNYWMGFCGGCGIHDASWRSEFGGNIYNGNGSHGCVNTPYNAVEKIYYNTGYDTPVIVY